MQLKTILISTLISLLIGGGFYYKTMSNQKRIAVIDAVKLVNNYKMKAELEAGDQVPLRSIKHQVDSLEQVRENALKMHLPEPAIQDLNKTLDYANRAMSEVYQLSNSKINEAVWKRLNPLIDAFSAEHGFQLVIGANGMGTVLYNDATYDHTDELIKYVNAKYEANQ